MARPQRVLPASVAENLSRTHLDFLDTRVLKFDADRLTTIHRKMKDGDVEISFVPWRGDFTRGIFVSSTVSTDLSQQELAHLYKDFYKDHPFTQVSDEPIFLKQVVNTNHAVIQLEKVGTKLVVHSAIDNLLKGASGQAVQNMNLMFGIEENTGLRLKAGYF